jgi:hypothetical protein
VERRSDLNDATYPIRFLIGSQEMVITQPIEYRSGTMGAKWGGAVRCIYLHSSESEFYMRDPNILGWSEQEQ